MRSFFILVLASLGLVVYSVYDYTHKLSLQPTLQPTFVIEKGESLTSIVRKLETQGYLKPNPLRNLYLKFIKASPKYGDYAIPEQFNLKSLIMLFHSGKVIQYSLTFPEGLTVEEIITLVNDDPMLSGELLNSKDYPEGYLLPDTYVFSRGTPRAQIPQQMMKAMETFVKSQWNDKQPYNATNLNKLLTLASLIEKEGVSGDRPLIASVFYNRLAIGMKLQTDPSVIYAVKLQGNYKTGYRLTKKDLITPHPYNTYTQYGLPPSPISNPSRESILAALQPATTNYLYFVAKPEGSGHNFASNYKDHLRNVALYRQKQ